MEEVLYQKILLPETQKVLQCLFEAIWYIDIKEKCFILKSKTVGESYRLVDYDIVMDDITKKYIAEDDRESFLRKIDIKTVEKRLEESRQYVLYTAMYNDGKNAAYKRLTFSYIDKQNKIAVLGKSDISTVVNGYRQQLNYYKKQSYHEPLTGIYNRKYYEEKLREKTFRGAVAMFDLDDFKLFNDIYSHSVGDMVLASVGEITAKLLNKGDMAIKYGGDEFLLIMPKIKTEDELKQRLRAVREGIGKIYIDGFPDINLSISIGGVIAHNETIEKAAARADELMYHAKNRKNTEITEQDIIIDDIDDEQNDSDVVKQQILIVDDSAFNRELLSEILRSDFKILTAANGEECVEKLSQYSTGITLILLDMIMPGMNGIDVLRYMNDSGLIEDIPVIMISSANTGDAVKHAYELGISDYIGRPFDAEIVRKRVLNTVKINMKQRKLVSFISNQITQKEKSNKIMFDLLSRIVELSNGENGMHVARIRWISAMILEQLVKKTGKYAISGEERRLIPIASMLHDIGKICIDKNILRKKEKLTDEEFEAVKMHTVIGARLLSAFEEYKDEPLVKTAIQVCKYHHERYDGNGYPNGLSGDDIPLCAQVVALADVYEALISQRTYKRAYSHDEAIKMIQNGRCGAFNPELLQCLSDISMQLQRKIAEEDAYVKII